MAGEPKMAHMRASLGRAMLKALFGVGRRFVRSENGVTAVEFALVSAPFVALLMAILETALAFFAQEALQTATTQAARLIMTGQVQNGGMSAAQFQQIVCNDAGSLFSCNNIYVNVQTFSTFSQIAMLNPVQNGNFQSGQMNFQPGNAGDIVVVQAFYQWPVFPAPLGFNLANLNGNLMLLVGTAAFRNEPYS